VRSLSPLLRGEGWGEGPLSAKLTLNGEQHTFDISEHIVVPEANDSVAFLVQTTIANDIGSGFIVLAAIHLNNELPLTANEVADVSAYRHLPREFVAVDLSVADAIP